MCNDSYNVWRDPRVRNGEEYAATILLLSIYRNNEVKEGDHVYQGNMK